MPDLSKPPLHTLPYEELLERLRALTNFRAIRDETSETGYRTSFGPVPAWDHLPEW